MDHAGAESARLLVLFSGLLEDAIKGPIEVDFLLARTPKHPKQPIFHCAAVELFDDMEDFQNGLGMCV